MPDDGVESGAQPPLVAAPTSLEDDELAGAELARLGSQGLASYAKYLEQQERLLQLLQASAQELLRSRGESGLRLDSASAGEPAPLGLASEQVVNWVKRHLGARMGLRVERLFDRLQFWDAGPEPRQLGDRIVWRSRYGPRKHRLVVPPHALRSGGWRSADGQRTPSELELVGGVRILLLGCPELEQWLLGVPEAILVQDGSQTSGEVPAVDLLVVGAERLLQASEGPEAALLRRAAEAGCPCAIWLTPAALPLWTAALNVPSGVLRLAPSLPVARAAAKLGRPCVPIGPALPPLTFDRAWILGTSASERHRLFWLQKPDAPASGSDWRTTLEGTWDVAASANAHELARAFAANQGARSAASLRLLVLERALAELDEAELDLMLCLMADHFAVVVPPQVEPVPPMLVGAPLVVGELDAQVPALLAKPSDLSRAGHLSWRFARSHFSRAQAARRLTAHTGIPALVSGLPLVSVICVSRRPERLEQCLALFRHQTYQHKELILVANLDALSPSWVELALSHGDVTLLRTDSGHSLGASLNRARALAAGELWAKMDDDDYYGPSYLADQVLALEASEAAVVGKGTFFTFVEGPNRLYLTEQVPEQSLSEYFVHGGTIVANRRAVEGIEFLPVERGTDTLFLQQCRLLDRPIYSSARFGFAYFRYASGGHHTFDVPSSAYLQNSRLVGGEFDRALIDA